MNSIEEDIKILEDLAKILDRTCENNNCEQSRAIEHLIKAYKELKDFKKQVTESENTNFIKYKNYIPVSLVEETIEELNKQLEEDLQDERKVNSNRFIIICQCKNCLQELLEKRK